MKTIATYDSAARTFTLEKGVWRGTLPIADLPKWLHFYRQQAGRCPAQAASYAEDVRAIEVLLTQLSVRQ